MRKEIVQNGQCKQVEVSGNNSNKTPGARYINKVYAQKQCVCLENVWPSCTLQTSIHIYR